MKHSFIDQYSDLDSFIHRLDPRVKFFTSLAFIIAVMLTPGGSWKAFAFYLGIILSSVLISRVPLSYVLKRSVVIFPFVIMIGIFIPFFRQGEVAGSYNIWLWQLSVTYSGLFILANIVSKAWLCILSLIILSATTSVTDLLRGLSQLGLPRVLVLILSFMYRYIFVLVDEAMRLRQARESRNFGGSRLHHLKTLGNMIGTLFIRSYERGERVYMAMLSRGFDGEILTLRHFSLRKADVSFVMVVVGVLILSHLLW